MLSLVVIESQSLQLCILDFVEDVDCDWEHLSFLLSDCLEKLLAHLQQRNVVGVEFHHSGVSEVLLGISTLENTLLVFFEDLPIHIGLLVKIKFDPRM